MTVLARRALPILAALAVAACSSPAASRSAPRPASSTPAPPSTTASPFCHDMQAFQAGVLVYRADVLKAAQGTQQLDVEGMRQRAVAIASLGQSTLASAPQEIAAQIHSVLDAIAGSADHMTQPGATVRDVYEPLFNDAATAAFDAVDNYDCTTTGG